MRTRVWLVGLGLIVAVGASVAAQRVTLDRLIPQPSPGVKFAAPWQPALVKGQTLIVGSVIDIGHVPVAGAKVQLRDLNTGAVLQEDDTNESGEYAFEVLEPGTYVVEMVLAGGFVVALSNAGSIARYETLQTVVQLPGRWDAASRNVVAVSTMSGFLGMSAETTMTAATLLIAVNQNIAPADAGEPVSP